MLSSDIVEGKGVWERRIGFGVFLAFRMVAMMEMNMTRIHSTENKMIVGVLIIGPTKSRTWKQSNCTTKIVERQNNTKKLGITNLPG